MKTQFFSIPISFWALVSLSISLASDFPVCDLAKTFYDDVPFTNTNMPSDPALLRGYYQCGNYCVVPETHFPFLSQQRNPVIDPVSIETIRVFEWVGPQDQVQIVSELSQAIQASQSSFLTQSSQQNLVNYAAFFENFGNHYFKINDFSNSGGTSPDRAHYPKTGDLHLGFQFTGFNWGGVKQTYALSKVSVKSEELDQWRMALGYDPTYQVRIKTDPEFPIVSCKHAQTLNGFAPVKKLIDPYLSAHAQRKPWINPNYYSDKPTQFE